VWLNERKKTRTKFEMILRKNSIENLNIFYKEYSHSIIAQAHFQFESKWTTQKTTSNKLYISLHSKEFNGESSQLQHNISKEVD